MALPSGTVGKLGCHVQEKYQACEMCPEGASCCPTVGPSGNGEEPQATHVLTTRAVCVPLLLDCYNSPFDSGEGSGGWGESVFLLSRGSGKPCPV